MTIRPLSPADWDALAALIHASLSTWYRTRLNSDKFGPDPAPFRVFPELYEALDPGCCLVAEEPGSGRLAGCVFYHPRETHWAVGIVNAHPDFAGQGVAKQLMQAVLDLAARDGKPVRLVSSAMNLDSFSLYTRLGFVPRLTFQDLRLTIPADGLPPHATSLTLRPATMADAPRCADLELALNGIRREHDYRHFITNTQGCWRLWVAERPGDGTLAGFLGAVVHPASRMAGPGVAADEETAAALLHAVLSHEFAGSTVVWLVPVHCASLVRHCYSWGARNVELHLASVLGHAPPMHGVTFPTFMPETG